MTWAWISALFAGAFVGFGAAAIISSWRIERTIEEREYWRKSYMSMLNRLREGDDDE